MALQIRDVPDDVRDVLAARAAASGQSLQSFLLTLVTDEARRARNLALLERFSDRDDGSQLSPLEGRLALELARHQREQELASRSPSTAP